MNILVLNGSPRPNGSTKKMVEAFRGGAESAGHTMSVVDVCKMKISGCIACEYCHTKGHGECVQKDDMAKIYALLKKTEMLGYCVADILPRDNGAAQMRYRQILLGCLSKKARKAKKGRYVFEFGRPRNV